ncbi:hypothetical protein AOZ07_15870 [Glutamicibacter halophytocola]|uniref:Kiwa anti-phage protein KwaB-like domain-containing protein n=1 Tax=Glutamicibacter halophytocola TaxID=1933880 RepID=UPI0006D4C0A1|nr:Kiwa anti-phage protein KwaB-like domain-containing protein [Glutamicibacter halophytocola]ALG30312.1 hypothetical protein AOZ07_15870 [Glutamicibacter halophytocola]
MIDITLENNKVEFALDHAELFSKINITSAEVKLLIGRRNRGKSVEVDQVKVSTDVKEEVLALANVAINRLSASEFPSFSETRLLEEEECFVKIIASGNPGDSQENLQVQDENFQEAQTMASLLAATKQAVRSTGRIALEDIKSKQFTFYVVAARTENNKDVYFVKRQRGFKVAAKGKIFTRYADGLEKIEEPIFGLAYDFDFVIFDNFIYIWNLDSFYSLFMDVEELQKSVPAFVESITTGLGVKVAPSALIHIAESAQGSVRRAQQIRRLAGSDWLNSVTAENLGEALIDLDEGTHGIDISGLEVAFESDDVELFLNIVEQRIFRGKFDGKTRQSQASKTL